MATSDIRWIQRFDNYQRALKRLDAAVALAKTRTLSELEQQGFIQAFEFTHELAWKVMKDFFKDQGNTMITGAKDATREAFRNQLLGPAAAGPIWMEMIQSRNETSHTYNEDTANAIAEKIVDQYHPQFVAFSKQMQLRRQIE